MPPVLLAAGLAVVLVLGGLGWWLTASGGCERATVDVTVAPELGPLTEELLTDLESPDGEVCVDAQVTAQEPLQSAGALGALAEDALPDVWVPDSRLWAARVASAELEQEGSMAVSPVVLGTSRAVVDDLGWSDTPPGWSEAMGTDRPLAVPDLASSAEALSVLAAVRTALGGDADADNAIVQAVLAAARSTALSPGEALDAGRAGSAEAPLVPVSEQEVYALNQDAQDAELVAVYPAEGSPVLDYPVLRVGAATGAQQQAVDVVVGRLLSDEAQTAVRDAGFRGPEGAAPTGAGPETGIVAASPEVVPLEAEQVQALLTRLSSLAAPSRILSVFDVSTSMEAPVGDGTRATLARDAAKAALSLVPDNYALGSWVFAYQLEGDRDWEQMVPTRELDDVVDGRVQREILDEQLDTLPDRLTPGGTGLYDTTLAAVRAAREDYDPTAVNSVLIVTDGANEDDDAGLGLEELLGTLSAEADPDRPVKVIGVALGPDADVSVLEEIADVTGGAAYSAVDETDLQTVLFDALRQRG
ncbi:substrate-binding domain-containing protein [Blastococcus sp. VKM Ac-2987]|uniref:substrate-binding domain-containing protein n=1 Tax=Blastococcus sp. VKM Ac-2987 TaxID=3004141 RepID=UPI0022AB76B4|nr:substrate-binding domain-containing protein [Blastococcus sp. VKM Ac-2987]MCZ2858417.1 substrate-binding domain-containing protein [Blastococcus sp. VKM Ac-2987]